MEVEGAFWCWAAGCPWRTEGVSRSGPGACRGGVPSRTVSGECCVSRPVGRESTRGALLGQVLQTASSCPSFCRAGLVSGARLAFRRQAEGREMPGQVTCRVGGRETPRGRAVPPALASPPPPQSASSCGLRVLLCLSFESFPRFTVALRGEESLPPRPDRKALVAALCFCFVFRLHRR